MYIFSLAYLCVSSNGHLMTIPNIGIRCGILAICNKHFNCSRSDDSVMCSFTFCPLIYYVCVWKRAHVIARAHNALNDVNYFAAKPRREYAVWARAEQVMFTCMENIGSHMTEFPCFPCTWTPYDRKQTVPEARTYVRCWCCRRQRQLVDADRGYN